MINSHNTNGIPNGIFGSSGELPADVAPLDTWPVGVKITDTNANDYDTETYITLKNGIIQRVTYDTGLNRAGRATAGMVTNKAMKPNVYPRTPLAASTSGVY